MNEGKGHGSRRGSLAEAHQEGAVALLLTIPHLLEEALLCTHLFRKSTGFEARPELKS